MLYFLPYSCYTRQFFLPSWSFLSCTCQHRHRIWDTSVWYRVQTNFENSAEYRISAEIRFRLNRNRTWFLKVRFRFNRNRNWQKKFGFNRILTEFCLISHLDWIYNNVDSPLDIYGSTKNHIDSVSRLVDCCEHNSLN